MLAWQAFLLLEPLHQPFKKSFFNKQKWSKAANNWPVLKGLLQTTQET
jgi:hypothetical protein